MLGPPRRGSPRRGKFFKQSKNKVPTYAGIAHAVIEAAKTRAEVEAQRASKEVVEEAALSLWSEVQELAVSMEVPDDVTVTRDNTGVQVCVKIESVEQAALVLTTVELALKSRS